MSDSAFAVAVELSSILGDLNSALRQWCEITEKQLSASQAADIALLDSLLDQREQLCPQISVLTEREKTTREAYVNCQHASSDQDHCLQMLNAQIDEQRATLASLGAHAAEMDALCASTLKEQMVHLGEQLDQFRAGKKANQAYRPAIRSVQARFLDKCS